MKNIRIFYLPKLHKDSYEALRMSRGHLAVVSLSIFFLIGSIEKDMSDFLRLKWEISVPLILTFLTFYFLSIYIFKKHGFHSKLFQYFDFLTKFILVTVISSFIYFANDPRTAWWGPYLLVLVFISQLSKFHWFYFFIFIFYPGLIGILFIYEPQMYGMSLFHRIFPIFAGVVSAFLYHYQCKLQHHFISIKENNLKLNNELHDLKIKLERERISRDLHDSLGASLTGNILYTEIAKEELKKDPDKAAEMLDQIEELSREALIKMREAVYSIMEDKELLQDFSSYIIKKSQELLKVKDIEFSFNCPIDINNKLDPKTKFHLYKAIGEWFTNILKHSDASRVQFECRDIGYEVRFFIEDNGKGFDINKRTAKGKGLENIKHRIEEIGGTVTIRSNPGEGSQLKITVFAEQISNADDEDE